MMRDSDIMQIWSRNGATPSLTWTDLYQGTGFAIFPLSQWSHAISDVDRE